MKNEEKIQNVTGLYTGMVQRIYVLHAKRRTDAEDVFQTAFPKYTQGGPFRDREHEEAWLLKATMNACRERFRSWFHRHVDLQTEMEACVDLNGASYPLLDTLNQLPPRYRGALCLFYYESYKMREVSGIKGKNEDTVHTQLKRDREALREKLGDELDDFR